MNDKLVSRILATTFGASVLLTLCLLVGSLRSSALGFAIGAAIAMFSVWSLSFAVRRFGTPDNPAAKFGLTMIALVKLLLNTAILSFALTSPYVNPFALFVGVGLVPCVIVLEVIRTDWRSTSLSGQETEPTHLRTHHP